MPWPFARGPSDHAPFPADHSHLRRCQPMAALYDFPFFSHLRESQATCHSVVTQCSDGQGWDGRCLHPGTISLNKLRNARSGLRCRG